ncbi:MULTISPECIES: hypothetical protein [unclassified Streptomyces]|uniref:hypothetical protein n=1 Tax=unclassified Streptomyces TaxID=2593676 RepID=UPI00331BAC5D
MTAASSARYPEAESGQARDTHTARQTQSETKPSFKTSEMFVYAASVIAVLIASLAVGDGSDGVDRFPADQAWLYVTLLTIGYLISRGLAKSGSRETTDTTRR